MYERGEPRDPVSVQYAPGMDLDVAARQHGCLHRDQIQGPVADGWTEIRPNVWLCPALETRWTFEASALLSIDPTAFGPNPRSVLSHISATHLYGVGVLTGAYHLTSNSVTSSDPQIVVHTVEHLPDWSYVEGIPTTNPAQTAADIAATCDADHAGRVINDMLHRGHVTRHDLDERLGASVVDELLTQHYANAVRH